MAAAARVCLVLLAAAALMQPAHARWLQATAPNCSLVHLACTGCSVSRTPLPPDLSSAALVCKSCAAPQYQLLQPKAPAAATCGCAPGYHGHSNLSMSCDPCPKNSWCPGGLGASAQRTPCGPCLMTATTLAQNASACITQPGCGFNVASSTAAVCSLGTYSSGSSQQPCTPCPAGLTTLAASAKTIQECMAPPGYFFQNMQARPCPQGTYKSGTDRAPTCSACPHGLTTPGPTSAAPSACSLAAPGYQPQLLDGEVVGVQPCPAGSYGPDGVQCIACPDGLTTKAEASTTPADCLAPPGYGFYADGTADASSGISTADLGGHKVLQCPMGTFKNGWSLEPCQSCGMGLLTDTSNTEGLALSSDQCYLAPGFGSVADATQQQLVASKCDNGTYGSSEKTYGLVARPCSPCPAFTTTPDVHPLAGQIREDSFTTPDSCRTLPGHGWEPDGSAVPCAAGFYAPGFDNQACVKCGEGLTTATTASAKSADCVPLPGWQRKNRADQYAVPCDVGYFSGGGPSSVCRKCPLGSTTLYAQSFNASQCSVCAPGWGYSGGSQCALCAPGSFSPGGSDAPCVECAPGQTSALGATSSGDCLDEFVMTAPYDTLPTPPSAWTTLEGPSTTNLSKAAAMCREACKADPRCQYYSFQARQADPSQNGCHHKLAPTAPADDTYVSLKLAMGAYAIWQAGADEYGLQAAGTPPWQPPAGTTPEPWQCLQACNKDAACLAAFSAKVLSSWQCWLIDGGVGLGTIVTGIKAAPAQLNNYMFGWTNSLPPPLRDSLKQTPAAAASSPSPAPAGAPPPRAAPNTPPEATPDGIDTATPPADNAAPVDMDTPAADSSAAPLEADQPPATTSEQQADVAPPPTTPGPAASPANLGASESVGYSMYVSGPNAAPSNNASLGAGAPAAPPAQAAQDERGSYIITTVAGYGDQASDGDGAPARSAGLYYPYGVTVDKHDNIYICDTHNSRVRKVDAQTGIITTVAGTGGPGYSGDGGLATAAALNLPTSVAFDAFGNMYITDTGNNRVRGVEAATGIISTVIGAGAGGFGGIGGPASKVLLNVPVHVAFDNSSNMYVACFASQRIMKVDARTGNTSIVAGVGTPGFSGDGGPATEAELNNPASIAFDAQQNMFVADSLNQRVRRVDAASGIISTYAGSRSFGYGGDGGPATEAKMWSPMGIAFDRSGNLLVSDTYNQRVRRVNASSGVIETIAGTGVAAYGGDNGGALAAQLSTPEGLAVDSEGSIFVADYANHRVRKLLAQAGIAVQQR